MIGQGWLVGEDWQIGQIKDGAIERIMYGFCLLDLTGF